MARKPQRLLERLTVPRAAIAPGDNYREISKADAEELARTIQREGLQNPPVVRRTGKDTYASVSGNRRLAAIDVLGWTEVPVSVLPADADATDVLIATVGENAWRKDPRIWELGAACAALTETPHVLKPSEVADRLGYSAQHVNNAIRVVRHLDPAVLGEVKTAKIAVPVDLLIRLAGLPEDQQRAEWESFKAGKAPGTTERGPRTRGDRVRLVRAEKVQTVLGAVRKLPAGHDRDLVAQVLAWVLGGEAPAIVAPLVQKAGKPGKAAKPGKPAPAGKRQRVPRPAKRAAKRAKRGRK